MEKNSIPRKLSIREFFKRFPDEATCLEHVMDVRFGLRHTCAKCGVVDASFHRLESRKAYACAHCGDNLYPCAGTIFQDSRTPLQVWFYAIYLFSVSRNGVSGMELHRTLGVTRKCGYRIGVQIRTLMEKANASNGGQLSGTVESDEVFLGGRGSKTKTVVLGLKERDGRLVTKVIDGASIATVRPHFHKHISRDATIHTDESSIYNLVMRDRWVHRTVNHSAKEYARPDFLTGGDTIHVNSLENFWAHFQASVRGTHVHISAEHTQEYLGEFTYRANHRQMGNAMFDALIAAL